MRAGQKRDLARRLRGNMTDAELKLWQCLRRRQLLGHRFRRQFPIGPYVADFACIERRLVIEVDGGQHLESVSDARRDAYLLRRGFRVLRFWNHDVLENVVGVVEATMLELLVERPHPGLPPRAGEGEERPHPGLPSRSGEGDKPDNLETATDVNP